MFGQLTEMVSSIAAKRTLIVCPPVLTLGGTSSEGASSWGEGLSWGWGCESVRAGVDDEEEGEDDGG